MIGNILRWIWRNALSIVPDVLAQWTITGLDTPHTWTITDEDEPHTWTITAVDTPYQF